MWARRVTMASDSDLEAIRPQLLVEVVLPERGPAWLADVIDSIEATGDARVTKATIAAAGADHRPRGVAASLLRVYAWMDGRLFGRADEPARMMEFGQVAQQLNAAAARHGPASGRPDLIIRLDALHAPVSLPDDPPFGTWIFDHGAARYGSARGDDFGPWPGGREMLVGESIVATSLVACSGVDRITIGDVVSSVDRLSLRRGSRGHLRKLGGLAGRSVSVLRRTGSLPEMTSTFREDAPTTAASGLGMATVMSGLARIPFGYAGRLLRRKVAPERWVVATSAERHDPRSTDGRPFRFLEAPAGREWADPFPVRTPDGDLVFIEEYVRADHRGRLAVVWLDDSQRGWRSVETILDLPTHLSYPFVFQWAGDWYLMPEQAATGGLQVYVAEGFPTRWRWHSTALPLPAADATIAEIDGLWWMFAAMSVVGGNAADELHLFHAPTPLGPWTAHGRNPVVSDVRTARPAGRIFRSDGAWHRVAQNGAISYGHSMAIVRIDRIDREAYHETVVDIILPTWANGLMATHTINSDAGLTAVDALRTESRLPFGWVPGRSVRT